MPNCFSLTKHGETKITPLVAVDEELCLTYGLPMDSVNFVENWVDTIGLLLALGKTYKEIREIMKLNEPTDEQDKTLGVILNHLETHYKVNAWAE